MMKNFLIILIYLCLVGCATTSLYKIASGNKENLSKLSTLLEHSVDVTKEEALKIMGTKTKKSGLWDWYITIKNPYKSETLIGKDRTIEVVYYFTDIEKTRLAGERAVIDDKNLTPVVFEDGKLIGWSFDFLYSIVQEYDLKWE